MNYNSTWITDILYPHIIEDKAIAALIEQKINASGPRIWLNTDLLAMTVNQTLQGTGLIERQFNLIPSASDEHFNIAASSTNLSFNGSNSQSLPGEAPLKPVSSPSDEKSDPVLDRTLVDEVVRTIYLNQFMRTLYSSRPNNVHYLSHADYEKAFSDAALNVRGNDALGNFYKDEWALKHTDRLNFICKVQYVAYMGQLNIATATGLVSLGITSPIDVLDYHGDFEDDFPDTQSLLDGAQNLVKEYLDFGFTHKGIQLAIEQQLIGKNVPTLMGYKAFLAHYTSTFDGNTDEERTKAAVLCYQRICMNYLVNKQVEVTLRQNNHQHTFLPLFETYPENAAENDPALLTFDFFQWGPENTRCLAPLLAEGAYYLRAGMKVEGMAHVVTHPDVQPLAKQAHEFVSEYQHYFEGENGARQRNNALYAYEFLCAREILKANQISAEAFVYGEAIALKGDISQFQWPNIGLDKERAFEILEKAQETGFVLRGGKVALDGMLFWTVQGFDAVDIIPNLVNYQFIQQYNYWINVYHPDQSIGGLNYLKMYVAFHSFYSENPQLSFKTLNLNDRRSLPILFGNNQIWSYKPQLLQWQLLLKWGATEMGAAVYLISDTPLPQWKEAWAFEGSTLQDKQQNLEAANTLYNEYHFLKDCQQSFLGRYQAPWSLSALLEGNPQLISVIEQNIKYDGKTVDEARLKTLMPLIDNWQGLVGIGMGVFGAMECAVEGFSKEKMLEMSRRTFVKEYGKYFQVASQAESAYQKYALQTSKNGQIARLMHSVKSAGSSLVAQVVTNASAQETEEHKKAKELVGNAGDKARQKTLNQGLISVLSTNNDQLVEFVPDPHNKTALKRSVISMSKGYKILSLHSDNYSYSLEPGKEISVPGLPVTISMNNNGFQNQPQLQFSTHNTNMFYAWRKNKSFTWEDMTWRIDYPTVFSHQSWPENGFVCVYDYENRLNYTLSITLNQATAQGISFNLSVERHLGNTSQREPGSNINDVVRDPTNLDKIYWCEGNAIFKGNLKTKELCMIYANDNATINSIGLAHNNYHLVWIEIQEDLYLQHHREKVLFSIFPQKPDKPGLLRQGTIDGHPPTTLVEHASLLPISRLNSTDQLGVWYWNSAKNYLNWATIFTPTLWGYNGSVYPLTSFESYHDYGDYSKGGVMLYDYRHREVVWASGLQLKRAALDGSNERVIFEATNWISIFPLGINPKNGEIYIASANYNSSHGFDTLRIQADGSYPVGIGYCAYPVRITTDYSEAEATLLTKKLEQIEARAVAAKNKYEAKKKQHELVLQERTQYDDIKYRTEQEVQQNTTKYAKLTKDQKQQLQANRTSHKEAIESAQKQAEAAAENRRQQQKVELRLNREQLLQQKKDSVDHYNQAVDKAHQLKEQAKGMQPSIDQKREELSTKKQERTSKGNFLKYNLKLVSFEVWRKG